MSELLLSRLSPDERSAIAGRFRVQATKHYLAKANRFNGPDENNPLLLQIRPDARELTPVAGEMQDPLGEEPRMVVPGLVHRYPHKVLWLTTTLCAAYCRYCTRKRIVSTPGKLPVANTNRILDYLKDRKEVQEVILSGGDPFIYSNRILTEWLQELTALDHIRSIRIHSRFLNFQPDRFNDGLFVVLAALQKQKPLTIVHHYNHALEVDEKTAEVAGRLNGLGIRQLNQSVLLRAVNDSAAVLKELSFVLHAAGIQPYYLHHLDRITGSDHFGLPLVAAHKIIKELSGFLPGMLVPRYKIDLPGGDGKVELSPNQPIPENGLYSFQNHYGETFHVR